MAGQLLCNRAIEYTRRKGSVTQAFEGEKTMGSETNQPKPTKQQDASNDSRAIEEKELDRLADEAAQRAEKREQRYDSEHDIFTK